MKFTRLEIIAVIALTLIALVRFFFFTPQPEYDDQIGRTVVFEGIITDAPDVRIYNQRVPVKPHSGDGKILLVMSLDETIQYGDVVRVTGVLEKPENFLGDNGREFNYIRYLANQDIHYSIQKPNITILDQDKGNKLTRVLLTIRTKFITAINTVIVPPESALMNGILLGTRGGFEEKERNAFITTGTIHIIALSGYNVTIVAESIMKVFGTVLRQSVALFFGMFGVILFVLLAGAQATAVRAGIMALIALLARRTGRVYDAGRALVIAALIMIAHDPRVITDISFQLSFLATIGVIFLSPKVLIWVRGLPERWEFRNNVATTLAATIMVLPLILYATGVLSFVSLPANILILPVIPITMLFGFLTGITGIVSPVLAIPFGFITDILLRYILGVVDFFASLPFASVTVFRFPLTLTISLYIFLFWYIFRGKSDS